MDALSDDLLDGAAAIAAYMFGDEKKRRRVYYLVEAGLLPVARIGNAIIGRKSTLNKFIDAETRRKVSGPAAQEPAPGPA